MKIVFPFGEGSANYCSPQYRTKDGCCDNATRESVYTWSGNKGCCRSPAEKVDYGAVTGCCTSLPVQTARWNQTVDSPCGNWCMKPNLVEDFGGASSCCSSCDGTRMNRTAADICGTSCCPQWYPQQDLCCSKGCDWITENINGLNTSRCCPVGAPHSQTSTLAFGGKNLSVTACCPAGQQITGAVSHISYLSAANSINYVNLSTSCCPYTPKAVGTNGTICCSSNAYTYLAGWKNHANEGGACYTNGNREYLTYDYGCCTTSRPTLKTTPNGTICCPVGREAFAYSESYYPWCGATPNFVIYSTGCCQENESAFTIPTGTICCPSAYGAFNYLSMSQQTQDAVNRKYDVGCCTASASHIVSVPGGTVCCPTPNAAAYIYSQMVQNWGGFYRSASCCPVGTQPIAAGTVGTICCSAGETAYLSSEKFMLYNNALFGYRYYPGCCPVGKPTYGWTFRRDYWVTTGLHAGDEISHGCCAEGTPVSLPQIGTGAKGAGIGTICCPNGRSVYAYHQGYFSSASHRYSDYAAGCCNTGQISANINGKAETTCCATGETAHAYWKTYAFRADGTTVASQKDKKITCLSSAGMTLSFRADIDGGVYCPTGTSGFFRVAYRSLYDNNARAQDDWDAGCCTAASPTAKSIPGNFGTYCCPAAQTVSASIGYSNNSKEMWIYPSCQ